MKIAQITCVFPPYKGGIGMMAYNHTKFLVSKGHQVDVITPQYNASEPRLETLDGFRIRRLRPVIKYGNAGLCPQIAQILSEYDVIHLHLPFFGVAEFVWLAKLKNPKLKIIVTYHMDVFGGFIMKPYFFLYRHLIMPKIIKSADRVIVTSNDYAAHSKISKLFYSLPNKFVELPPEVNTEIFKYTERTKKEEKVILFVGGMDKAHYFKGVPILLKAFAILLSSTNVKARLILVGQGELQNKYKKLALDLAVTELVDFVGPASSQDLPKYYAQADVFVLPSIDSSEAFGIVSIEALSCGTPIVVSRLPGVRTVVREGVNGFTFGVKKEGELAGKIHDVLSSSFNHSAIAEEARGKYDARVIGQKLLELYNSII